MCVCMSDYIYIYICVCLCNYIYICVCVCVIIYIYIYIYIWVCVCNYVCVSVCNYIYSRIIKRKNTQMYPIVDSCTYCSMNKQFVEGVQNGKDLYDVLAMQPYDNIVRGRVKRERHIEFENRFLKLSCGTPMDMLILREYSRLDMPLNNLMVRLQ